MRLAIDTNLLEELRKAIKDGFAEFNQLSVASHSRRYPADLRELISQGHLAGLKSKELMKLSGMSATAVTYAIKYHQRIKKPLSPYKPSKIFATRRLDVVQEIAEPVRAQSPILIRLPSGVVLELNESSSLTPVLIHTLANVEVNHV